MERRPHRRKIVQTDVVPQHIWHALHIKEVAVEPGDGPQQDDDITAAKQAFAARPRTEIVTDRCQILALQAS
eukprot:4275717-Pyramimonas_sp.AAC.1